MSWAGALLPAETLVDSWPTPPAVPVFPDLDSYSEGPNALTGDGPAARSGRLDGQDGLRLDRDRGCPDTWRGPCLSRRLSALAIGLPDAGAAGSSGAPPAPAVVQASGADVADGQRPRGTAAARYHGTAVPINCTTLIAK